MKIVRVCFCCGSWGFSGSGMHQLQCTIAVDCKDFPEVACADHGLPFPWVMVNPYKCVFKRWRLFCYHHTCRCHSVQAWSFTIPSLIMVIWCERNPLLFPYLSQSFGAAQSFATPSLVVVIWHECNPSPSPCSSWSFGTSTILCHSLIHHHHPVLQPALNSSSPAPSCMGNLCLSPWWSLSLSALRAQPLPVWGTSACHHGEPCFSQLSDPSPILVQGTLAPTSYSAPTSSLI